MRNKSYAVIVAGGKGERMGSAIPKQFLEIGGRPVLRWTMERFLSLGRDIEMIVVLPTAQKGWWKDYCRKSGFNVKHVLVSGGITRFHSVQNALKYVEDGAVVAVHDGVRPVVSADFLNRMFDAAAQSPAVIPVMPAVESVREMAADGSGSSRSVDRSRLVTVQTPQVFHSEILKEAYSNAYSPLFTDDASVVEASGYAVTVCPGEKYNIKITTPDDLRLAGDLLAWQSSLLAPEL